jgi:hypothetical protein
MVLGFILGFVYNSQLDPTVAVPAIPQKFQLASMKELDGLTVDYSLLMSPQFQELRIYGELPVPTESTGRDNIFR